MGALNLKHESELPALREDRFTTLVKQKPDQLSYWRELSGPILDITPASEDAEGFAATLSGHDLGKLHIASFQHDAMQYRRTEDHIRRMDVDHWQLVLRTRGVEVCDTGNQTFRNIPGSLDLRSYAAPIKADASDSSVICIWLARDNYSDLSELLDAAIHRPIGGTMRPLLQEFILSLDRHRTALTSADVPALLSSFTTLLAATLGQTRDRMADATLPIAAMTLELARKHIEANLGNPSLGAETLCQALKISRRKLYYLFERRGGVHKYIRQRRLEACHAALGRSTERRLISTIAYDYGFTDSAQFSRLFRSHFGYSPKEARERRGICHGASPKNAKSLVEWLLQLHDN